MADLPLAPLLPSFLQATTCRVYCLMYREPDESDWDPSTHLAENINRLFGCTDLLIILNIIREMTEEDKKSWHYLMKQFDNFFTLQLVTHPCSKL